jgi:hypothetical protein
MMMSRALGLTLVALCAAAALSSCGRSERGGALPATNAGNAGSPNDLSHGRHVRDIGGLLPGTVLNPLYRVKIGGVDSMTSASWSEQSNFPSDGLMFYAPGNNPAGTVPLYRLNQPSIPDHMDSGAPGEGGYNTDGVLAWPWTSPNTVFGLSPIARVFNGQDHAIIRPGESLPGYNTTEGFGLWGYARYGNTAESLLTLTAGGVTIQSNAVAGGSLWNWTQRGTQYVNHPDFGREIQSALFYFGNNPTQNPTEAGDIYSTPGIAPAHRHGSPLLVFQNSGNTQSTRAVPLEFTPDAFGGSPDQPVIYTGMWLGKDITLNYAGLGAVAQYTTVLFLPSALPNSSLEFPSGYLAPSFQRYYDYDAATATERTAPVPACNGSLPSFKFPDDSPYSYSGYGGVIIADTTGANAMGIYAVLKNVGGPASYFRLYDLHCVGGPSAKWNVVTEQAFSAGQTTYNSWIASGTLAEVESAMRQLYAMGVR